MADYFTNFSFILPLTDNAQKSSALEITHLVSSHRQEDQTLPSDFPASLTEVIEDWTFELEGVAEGLWLHSDSGGIDAACAFVQHLLQKFNPSACVTFEWSHDCSKPRFDAYGGGAAIVTASEIKTINTADMAVRQCP